ncbi:uncharacterized protein DUF1634 [Luteibacter rhizovicinus]|uniref:Uncharacterized protein DUF1634 n=1 Tax=Luteibacter rhizovicinus TaxID=242606 RepID=A0A4R3Z1T1_9GAMM|nr:DUF1634 domain-containing protein [Luteibacter rhizovicinus]TCV97753.1 uncharacterized protein DUF1634 [Luteibacter rhizovicinus]
MTQPKSHVEDHSECYDRIIIARLLQYGTWGASVVIAIGIVLSTLHPIDDSSVLTSSGYTLGKTGIVIVILLPIARVALMLALFLRERDYIYAMISMLVLVIIGAGILASL